jgi:hypothetical protein
MHPCKCKIALVITTSLLTASSCLTGVNGTPPTVFLSPTASGTESDDASGYIEVQTSQPRYGLDEGLELIVTNDTPTDIRISVPPLAVVGEEAFRFYERTATGWRRLYPIPGYHAEPLGEGSSLVVPAGGERELDITHTLGAYMAYASESPTLTGEFLIQVRYGYADSPVTGELVQYSNEFRIGEEEPALGMDVNVQLVQRRSIAFTLTNNSDAPLWIPICSSIPVHYGGRAFSDDGYSSLQRLTDNGTWQIIRDICLDPSQRAEPIQVCPGQEVSVDPARWFYYECDNLPPGTYRWDVVFYLEDYGANSDRMLRDVRHVFSDVFECDP